MDGMMDFINEHVIPHWPFFTWLIVAMLIGQVSKNALWTKANAAKHADPNQDRSWKEKLHHSFFWWGRKTMVLHPVAVGMIIGTMWRNPEGADPAWELAADMGYFALSGALSTWAYEFLKGLAKKKGVNLDLPGITPSSPPPPKEGGK